MKTKVEVTSNVYQCQLKKGEFGYIDGYVKAGDDRPYAVVVVDERIDFVPLHALKVIQCYYNDDYCLGNVVEVNTHHGYLCEKCAKETESYPDEPVDIDYSFNNR